MSRARTRRAPTPARQARWPGGGDPALDTPSTSHISIVDRYGNAVAMTSTIEDQFGSRLMTAGGFLLNNELTDFSFVPDENGKPVANRVRRRQAAALVDGARRSPTIAQGRVAIVTGSPGGSRSSTTSRRSLIAIIDWDLDPQAAAALPNFGSRNGPTELEKDTEVAKLAPKLRALGADVTVVELTSGVHTIVRTRNGWVAARTRDGKVS